MRSHELVAEFREGQGKGASRRLRHAGNVPAILYGGNAEPVSIKLNHNDDLVANEKMVLLLDPRPERRRRQAEGALVTCRSTRRAAIMHLDMQRVNENEDPHPRAAALQRRHLAGRQGRRGRGLPRMTEVEVSCLPKDLPEFIELDLADLEVGDRDPPVATCRCRRASRSRRSASRARTTPCAVGRPPSRCRDDAEGAAATGRRRRGSAGCQGAPSGRRQEGRRIAASHRGRAARSICLMLGKRARQFLHCVRNELTHGRHFDSSSGWAIPGPSTRGRGTTPASGSWTSWRAKAARALRQEGKLFGEIAQVASAAQAVWLLKP